MGNFSMNCINMYVQHVGKKLGLEIQILDASSLLHQRGVDIAS